MTSTCLVDGKVYCWAYGYHINGDKRLISYLGAVKVTLGYLTPTLLYKLGHGAPITMVVCRMPTQ